MAEEILNITNYQRCKANHHLTPFRTTIKKSTVNAGEGMEKRNPPPLVGGNINWCSHYEEDYGGSFKN